MTAPKPYKILRLIAFALLLITQIVMVYTAHQRNKALMHILEKQHGK